MRVNLRFWVGVLAAGAVLSLIVFAPHEVLTLERLKESRGELEDFVRRSPVTAGALYFAAYVVMAALSIPGATVVTLAGAAVFGFWLTLVLVSFSSTIGATLSFLLCRYLFRGAVQQRFGDRLEQINRGIEAEGAFYLFALRLVPAFPFFVINALMGLTPMRVSTYYLVSQIGMLPGTAAYVFAGTELGKIESLSEILSPRVLSAFIVLGVLPLVTKKLVSLLRSRRSCSVKTLIICGNL